MLFVQHISKTAAAKLVEAFGIRGAFNTTGHNWDPYWSSSLFGSYSAVRYGGNAADIATANGAFCANYVLGKVTSADFSCNPDFNIAQLGVVTRWTPVKNLTFSAEVMWTHLEGEARTALLEGPKPARGNPPVSLWHGRKTKPSVLNPANRRAGTAPGTA